MKGQKVLDNALAEARARFPGEIRNGKGCWADLARLLSQRQQTLWNWRDRGVPGSALVLMADKLRCSIDDLRRGTRTQTNSFEEADLTHEEAMLIAHYRLSDEKKREAIFRLVTNQNPPPTTEAERPPGAGVIPLRRRN